MITGKANVGYALAAWMIVHDAGDDRHLPAAAPPRRAVAAMSGEATVACRPRLDGLS